MRAYEFNPPPGITPTTYGFNEAFVPPPLKALPQWVCWGNPHQRELSKVPKQPNGQPASSTDSTTWSAFDACRDAMDLGKVSGIGFVFSEHDQYLGVDLDDCFIDASASQLKPWALAMLDTLPVTYSELSPSGAGLHLFFTGTWSGDRNHFLMAGGGAVEVYDRARYFTITGKAYGELPAKVAAVGDLRSALMQALCPFLATDKQISIGPPQSAVSVAGQDAITDQSTALVMTCLEEVQKMPDAVEGQRGRTATWLAAKHCWDRGLSKRQVWDVMRAFNEQKAIPSWSEVELKQRIDEAYQEAVKQGSLGLMGVESIGGGGGGGGGDKTKKPGRPPKPKKPPTIWSDSPEKSVFEKLQLSIISKKDTGEFVMEYRPSGHRHVFRSDKDITYASLAGLVELPLLSKHVYYDRQEEPAGRMFISDFVIEIMAAKRKAEVQSGKAIGDGVWKLRDDLFLVNNHAFYRLDGTQLTRIQNDQIAGYYCDYDSSRHWIDIKKLQASLQSMASPAARAAAYTLLRDTLATWKWADQEHTPDVCAGAMCATWIQSLFSWRPIIVIAGVTNSGKSTFAEELFKWFFLEAAKVMFKSTEAGIRQTVRMAAMPIMHDEYDKNKNKAEVLELFRGSSRGQEVRKGTPGTQREKVFHMRHIPWLAGINVPQPELGDQNRSINFEALIPPSDGKSWQTIQMPTMDETFELGYNLLAAMMIEHGKIVPLAKKLGKLGPSGDVARYYNSYAVPYAVTSVLQGWSEEVAAAAVEKHMKKLLVELQETCDVSKPDCIRALETMLWQTIEAPYATSTTRRVPIHVALFSESASYEDALALVGLAVVKSRATGVTEIAIKPDQIEREVMSRTQSQWKDPGMFRADLRRLPKEFCSKQGFYRDARVGGSKTKCYVLDYAATKALISGSETPQPSLF